MSKQKFKLGWRVKVADKLPLYMHHFESGFEGIVCEHSDGEYGLIQLQDNKPINAIWWYQESLLTLISDDSAKGKKIIKQYIGED
jgi:hypothetical protein